MLAGRVQSSGTAVLVDRLWPRGVAKKDLSYDLWLPEAAPSVELRRWFGHDPNRFDEFARRYRAELAEPNPDVDRLLFLADEGDVSLLYAARDRECNHAVVLARWLREAGAGLA
nr:MULTISPECIES: DUF488 family protein [unclassified Corynebacterium]